MNTRTQNVLRAHGIDTTTATSEQGLIQKLIRIACNHFSSGDQTCYFCIKSIRHPSTQNSAKVMVELSESVYCLGSGPTLLDAWAEIVHDLVPCRS